MVQGGLPVGSSVVLQGPPGQEKLRFALTFLAEGLKSGGSGLVITSSQSPDAVMAELRELGVDLDSVTNENRLRVVDWYSWSEETVQDIEDRGIVIRSSIDLTNLGVALSRAITGLTGGGSRRAVIELLSPATSSYEVTQVYAFAQSAKRKFDRHQFTSLVLLEKEMHSSAQLTTLHQPFDGVIEIERTRSGDRIVRKIGVLHIKDTAPDHTFRVLEMSEAGLRVVLDTPKAAAAGSTARGGVLESQDERAQRLRLILQIATERLKLNPGDADALFAMAAAQATLDDAKGGLETLDRLAGLDSAYPGLWVLKTKLHAKLGQADLARQSRVRAQHSEPEAAKAIDATVPCPMCEEPVAIDATTCPNCGVKFASTKSLEDELDDLGHAAIQEMVQEELGAAKGMEKAFDKPEVRAPKPETERDVPPAKKPTDKTPSKKGLTNGLVLGRRGASKAGRTNGLRGRTNGLRGRTNGLTNGLGRTNGLTNGLGRTNGLTNGLGRTNGLTNGLGRTNGLTNGLGRTNGLTNGLGGVRPIGFHAVGLRRAMSNAGWKLYLIPLVSVALLLIPLFLVPTYRGPAYPIQIDGQFADWNGVPRLLGKGATRNPDIDITDVAVKDNLDYLSFYLKVQGDPLAGEPAPGRITNAFYAFIDVDRSRSTGYQVQGIGADRMVWVNTFGGRVVSVSLMGFNASRSLTDWFGWMPIGPAHAAGSGSELEFQAAWSDLAPSPRSVDVAFASRSWDGQSNAADIVVTNADSFVVVSQDTRAPTILTASTPILASFTFHAVGGDVSVISLNVTMVGTFQTSSLSTMDLSDEVGNVLATQPASRTARFDLDSFVVSNGANRTLSLRPNVVATDGTTVGAFLKDVEDVRTSGGIAFTGPARTPVSLAYIGLIPNAPVVDGAFSDWPNITKDPLGDVQPRWNPDVDLSGYAFQASSGGTLFMAQVVATALNGTMIPVLNPTYIPPANSSGNGTVSAPPPPPPENGADVIRFFLDADGSGTTGYSVGGIGADFLVEITGKEGLILSSKAMQFAGSRPWEWSWTILSTAPAAKDRARIEAAVPGVAITNASRATFETSGWGGSVDRPSSPVVGSNVFMGLSTKALSMNPISVSSLATGSGLQPLATLIDSGSNSASTVYNQQRKVVRAGTAAGPIPCDATNSAGCWYTVFRDQTKPPDSAFKDGTSVAVPTTLGLLDSLATSLTSGDNVIVVVVQLDDGQNGQTRTFNAGDIQLRRGTLTTDPLITQTKFRVLLGTSGSGQGDLFVVLLGKDASAPANPTYGVFAQTSGAQVTAAVRLVVINSLASADSVFGDGASTPVTTSSTTLLNQATSLPAASTSIPNIIIAAVQYDSTGSGPMVGPANTGARVLRGATVLASNQFAFRTAANIAPNGLFAFLVAIDSAAPANPTYTVDALNSDTSNTVNGAARLLIFRNLTASSVASGSVSIGTSRTVMGTASTTFLAGDDVVIGAIQLDAQGSQRTIAAGTDDIRRTGDSSASSNTFAEGVAISGNPGSGLYQMFVRKVTTTAANPSYEGAATSPAAGALNAELKLVTVHVRDTNANGWDRIIIRRSLDVSGATWGSQIVLASARAADSPLLYTFDSAEPSIAIDSGGFLHVVWVSAASPGDQSTLNLVRYTKTTVAYPTDSQLANAANWQAITNVDDTSPGYMPTVSTDSSSNPHIAWSGSKTSGTVYYKNKALGTWRSTISWSSTYTGLSVDVSPQTNYVALARDFENTPVDAAIGYRSNTGTNTVNSLKTRTWDSSAWNVESEQATAGSPIRVVRMAWSPVEANTRIVVTESDDGWLDAYVCNPTCTVTNNIGQVWTTAPTTAQARFDVAYEGVSGRAILVYHKQGGSSTQDIAYKTYSGGTWSAEQYIDDGFGAHNVYSVIKLASKKASNQIGMVGGDLTNTRVNAWIWDGTTWGNFVAIATTSVGPLDRDGADLAWESSSGNLLVVSASNTANIVSKEYSSSWGGAVTFACASAATIRYTRLKANPLATANDMVLAVVSDPSFNLNTCYWTGSAWASALTHAATAQVNFRSFDFAWEATGSKGLLVFSNTAGPNWIEYRTFTAPSTWGTITAIAMGSSDHTWIEARTNPFAGGTTKILGAASENSAQSLGAFRWDGTTFTVIGTSTFTASTGGFMDNEMFDLKYREAGAGATGEIHHLVCKDLSASNCTTAAKFTKFDGTAGFDTVATLAETSTYPSIATSYAATGDLWIAYAKDINATTRAIYARFLSYPTSGFAAAETIDVLSGTQFARPTIGLDKDGNVYAFYVALSGPQLYTNSRISGSWGVTRTAIDTTTDYPSLIVRAPNDSTYGSSLGAVYWKAPASQTYFYYVPEFEDVAAPIISCLFVALILGRRATLRSRRGFRHRR